MYIILYYYIQMQYILTVLYFLITLYFPNLYTYFMETPNIQLFKIVNILLLAGTQNLLLKTNPFIYPMDKSLYQHLKFCLNYYLPMVVGISIIINLLPYKVGIPYPLELSKNNLFLAFVSPYYTMVFYMYIAKYISLQVANFIILIILLTFNLPQFSLNPMILIFSCMSRGYSIIYFIQMFALVFAIYTFRNNIIKKLYN
jgi:hypothetical protein